MRSCLRVITLTSLLCGNLLAADHRVVNVDGTSINITTFNHNRLTAASKRSPELSEVLQRLEGSTPIETTFRGQVPLEPHAETDHYLSFTMFISRNQKPGKEAYTFQCVTDTYLNVKHKLLMLSVAATTKDLQWSRDFSKIWAEDVLAANP